MARYVLGVLHKNDHVKVALEEVAGETQLVLRAGTKVVGVAGFGVRDGLVSDIWLVLNPDKLQTWNGSPA